MSSADLLVLGAGPAGLAAAWRAASRGLSVTVLERSQAVGGLASSFEIAGVRVDHGSHRLHPTTPPGVMADLRALLGNDLQTRPRRGRLRIGGRWVGFPLRAGETMRALPRPLLSRIAFDSLTGPLRRSRAETYADVLRRGLGPGLYDALYGPYAIKLWGLPGERIDADQARKRVAADTPAKIAARVLRGGAGSGQGRVFHYPRRGYGQIAESLADAAVAAGAEIRLGTVADEIDLHQHSVVLGTADGEWHEARHVFSTIPLPALAHISSPGPPLATVEAAARLKFRAMVLVYLVHEGGRFSPYDAHYLPGLETPVTRFSEPANYRDSADDPRDRSVLCFEIPCTRGDALWEADDADLAGRAQAALAVSGLPPARPVEVEVRRLAHVYPVYEVGYARHLEGLEAWAAALPTLTSFGRLGLFTHDNTHHALVMAYDAVDAFGSEGFDRIAWAAARERFAGHVVED
ncbi:MAG: protoporphyrinogen/coproporphyrinogen oxidase [Carbonactinosporaceae bacterium]